MKELYLETERLLKKGEDLVWVSVTAGTGSTPRGAGAKMLMRRDGSTLGTVGGGAVEYEAGREAQKALEEKRSFTKEFSLVKGESKVGMICGGGVEIYFQYVKAGDYPMEEICRAAVQAYGQDGNSWLITEITGKDSWTVGLFREGFGLEGLSLPEGVTPEMITGAKAEKREAGGRVYYSEPIRHTGLVYVFGGGYVAQELVPVLAHLDFSCAVFDDREEFACKKLFPQAAKIIVGDFDQIFSYISVREEDYAVIMTRGHQCDYVVQKQILKTPAHYIGVMGSKKKLAALEEKLHEDGYSQEDFKRFHGPIGVPVLADTPAEIAVSVAAEMIRVRAQREGRKK